MKWYMVTMVGRDRRGIVARISGRLFDGGCNLGEASMARLGASFTIMMMVEFADDADGLTTLLRPVCDELALRLHVDEVETRLHTHIEPNVRISVFGSDRAGIVAQVTAALAGGGLNICHLETDVGGSENKPIYIMHIEGDSPQGSEVLRQCVAPIKAQGIDITIADIETLVG